MIGREDKESTVGEGDVDDFSVQSTELRALFYNRHDNDSQSDEEIAAPDVAAMNFLNDFGATNDSNEFADESYSDVRTAFDDSDEEKLPVSGNENNYLEPLFNDQDDTLDEEKSTINQKAFKKLAKAIYHNETPNCLYFLELPLYKPHKLVIYQGLQQLDERMQSNAVIIAAVFLARENALHVARAINNLEDHGICFFPEDRFMQAACLGLIDAGKDAEIIASTITRFNNRYRTETNNGFTNKTVIIYINLLLTLKQAGIMLTDNICMVIAKIPESSRQQVIESLIELQGAGILTDHFYLTLAFYNQYDFSKKITELLIALKNKMPLTKEMITLIIINGSLAAKIIEEIKDLATPSAEDIETILIKRAATSSFVPASSSKLKLIKAGIPLTNNLWTLLAKAKAFHQMDVAEESVIALEEAGIPTERLQLTLDLYNQYGMLENITDLLILLKKKLGQTVTDEFIDFVMKDSTMVSWINKQIKQLMQCKLKPSIALITALFACEDTNNIINVLKPLCKHPLFPKVMHTDASEMKLPVLTPRSVVNIIKAKDAFESCKMLAKYRDDIELLDDLIVECMLSRSPEEMPGILESYVSLKRDGLTPDDARINDISFAILCGTGSGYIDQLIEDEKEKIVNAIKGKELLPLPRVLVDCVLSFFYCPSSMVSRPGCTVELENDQEEQKPTAKRLS